MQESYDYDVFNGDADGLCALQQLRLAEPRKSILITGPKRELALLKRVPNGSNARLTVLDLALDFNHEDLNRLLAEGACIQYFDHHCYTAQLPQHPNLKNFIDYTQADRGTSLLVDQYLAGKYRAWAVVGTFGDNFDQAAYQAAEVLDLTTNNLNKLREFGIYLNYNGYGSCVEDLHCAPDQLFLYLHAYLDPLDFIAAEPVYFILRDGYQADLAQAQKITPDCSTEQGKIFILPTEPWARRVSGVWANQLVQQSPYHAHAILSHLSDGGFLVSVRAPLNNLKGADQLCRQFATGGGRKAAAGINYLPSSDYERFVTAFFQAWK